MCFTTECKSLTAERARERKKFYNIKSEHFGNGMHRENEKKWVKNVPFWLLSIKNPWRRRFRSLSFFSWNIFNITFLVLVPSICHICVQKHAQRSHNKHTLMRIKYRYRWFPNAKSTISMPKRIEAFKFSRRRKKRRISTCFDPD